MDKTILKKYFNELKAILKLYENTQVGKLNSLGVCEFKVIPEIKGDCHWLSQNEIPAITINYDPKPAKRALEILKVLKQGFIKERINMRKNQELENKLYLCWDIGASLLGVATTEEEAQKMCYKTGQSYMPIEPNTSEKGDVDVTELCIYNISRKFYPYEVAISIPRVTFKKIR